MAKEELLEFDGTVTEVLPDGNFRVKLDNEHEVLAYTAGKMRKFRIRTGVGGRIGVVMRGGEALEVVRTGGRRVVVTVGDAATGAALLNTLAARARA